MPRPALWLQVLALALVTLPLATLAVAALVGVCRRPLTALALAAACACLAAALVAGGASAVPATSAKLLAAGAAGIALSALLSGVVEVVGIALLVALVDAYSVVAGPTHTIVEHHERVLDAFTLGLQPPGANAEALLGVSDIVFLGLFCGAARRLGLRARLTWLATSASFGLTLALAYGFDVALPALPLLSAGFLAANGDLLLARLRRR